MYRIQTKTNNLTVLQDVSQLNQAGTVIAAPIMWHVGQTRCHDALVSPLQAKQCWLPIFFMITLCTAPFAASENLQVTCGSTIKLQHTVTKFRLHSHQVAYSRGSQQQSVTGFPEGDDGNSLWVVQGTEVGKSEFVQHRSSVAKLRSCFCFTV